MFKKKTTILLIIVALLGIYSFADRGDDRDTTSNVQSNMNSSESLEQSVEDSKLSQEPEDNSISNSSQDSSGEITVYVTKTGSKYHRDGCQYLSQSKIPMSLEDAVLRYEPCSVCDPPIPDTYQDSPAVVPAPSVEPAPVIEEQPATTENQEIIVYVTNTGSKYHNAGCSYLKSSNPMTLSEAKAAGYTPCSRCHPPE